MKVGDMYVTIQVDDKTKEQLDRLEHMLRIVYEQVVEHRMTEEDWKAQRQLEQLKKWRVIQSEVQGE